MSPADAELRHWDQRTYEYWQELLEGASDEYVKRIGLGLKPSAYFWAAEGEETGRHGRGLWWRDAVREFEVLDLRAEREGEMTGPKGAVFGVAYQSVCINVPVYLNYLFTRVKEMGGRVVKADVDVENGLAGVVRDVKSKLMGVDEGVKEGDVFAVINCTGLGAKHFLGREESEKLYPIRGQTILVKGEAKVARTWVGFGETHEVAYVIPRPGSGTTILGGCKQVGNWSGQVDEELNGKILEVIKKERLAEELKDEKGDFEVLSYQVGHRPGRKGGPRVELEGKEKLEGTWLVHSYGHSGAGYQNSVGSAEKVVRLVSEL